MGFESALKTIGTWSQKLSSRKEEGFMSRFQLISLSFLIISRLFHICQQKVLWLLNLYIKKQIIPVVRRQRQDGSLRIQGQLGCLHYKFQISLSYKVSPCQEKKRVI